jgi:hypothetical protein
LELRQPVTSLYVPRRRIREAVTLFREGQKINYDQQILGESNFVSQVLVKKYDEPFKNCADRIDFDVAYFDPC